MQTENIEIINKIGFNFLQDCKKKDISKLDRAKMIDFMLKSQNISVRQLARDLEMSHSTIQDWYMYKDITEDEYNKIKDAGYNEKQIYVALRKDKIYRDRLKQIQTAADLKLETKPLDDIIRYANSNIKKEASNRVPKYSNNTLTNLKELQNSVNRLIAAIERHRHRAQHNIGVIQHA